MRLVFSACGALACAWGLAACSHTPAQTADDHTYTTDPNAPAVAAAPSDPSVTTATPSTSSNTNGALVAPTDNGLAAPGNAPNDAKPSQPAQAALVPAAGTAPDNTRVNKRDTDSSALTPLDQGNGQTDLKITQQIRQAVMSDGSLSFTAKNVKIITVNGKVTLRGPVNSDAERSSIEAAARKVAGAQVDNQLEVKK